MVVLFTMVINASAETYKLEIPDKGKENPIGLNGEKFSKKIINEDLENGTFQIELTFDNTDYTEVIFVIDNSAAVDAATKTALTTAINNKIDTLISDYGNVKIGSISVGDSDTIETDLSSDAEAIKAGINAINEATPDGSNHVLKAIKTATAKFSKYNVNRVIVVFSTSTVNTEALSKESYAKLGNFEDSDEASCNDSECTAEGGNVDFIIFNIDDVADTTFSDYFGTPVEPTAGKVILAGPATIEDEINNKLKDAFEATLPASKKDVVITDNIPKEISDLFEITNVTTETGTAELKDNKVEWQVNSNGDYLERNKKITLVYDMKLLTDKVDAEYIDIVLNLNTDSAPVKINYNYTAGDLPKGEGTYTSDCNPKVKILVSSNPKTGVINYSVAGIILIIVAGSTLYLSGKNKKFDTI